MLDVFLDALKDSSKVFAVVLIIYFILSFIENSIGTKLQRANKFSPFFGAMSGIVPQCGISVVAGDLYIKHHITMGTIIAVFFACSDEALPLMLSDPKKAGMIVPLLLIKLAVGFSIGFLVDLIYRNQEIVLVDNTKKKIVASCNTKVKEEININNEPDNETSIHTGCCHHPIDDKKESNFHEHVVHPLVHSLKIFAYVLILNIILGIIIYFVGQENIAIFLDTNKYLSPIFALLIGLIPNCASSVVLTNLFLAGGLPFGALITGLSVNAGLGILMLFKNKKMLKKSLIIISILMSSSLITGYICLFIF